MFNKTALELAREISVASADGTLNAPLGYATAEMLRSQAEVLSGMKAQRFAYASEFTLDEEGQPDVGSIHQNIRGLKAETERLKAQVESALSCSENANKLSAEFLRERDQIKAKNEKLVPMTEREMYAVLVHVCANGSAPSFAGFLAEVELIKYTRAIETWIKGKN